MTIHYHNYDPDTPRSEPVRGSNGAACFVESVAGAAQGRNREFAAVSTRESCTWSGPVTEVTVTVVGEAAGTANLLASAAICFDAPSDLVADTWLTHADSAAADSNCYVIPIGASRTFFFSGAGVTRLDAKRLYGSEALAVFVEAG